MIKLYDRVRILGNSVDVPLGNIFTQVYILDKPTAYQRFNIEELRKQANGRVDSQRQLGQRLHGLNLIKTGSNLFILGKPGAGKTTFLKYITVQAARKQLPRIPIFISLNQWADSKWGKGVDATILPFIIEQFDSCDFPNAELFIDYLLKQGRALVLFDGLDEVKQEQEQRRRLTRLLQDFASKYDQSQHLITCRIAASDYAFAGFADVEVADFTPEQVSEYARNWFGDQTKKFEAFTTELAKAENQGLRELCKTPLLLSLLCLTFDNTMRFPPNRAELYEDALETLLRCWDSSRQIQRDEIYRELSHKRKLQLLMNIAVPNFEKGELFFRQRHLEKWIVDYLAKLPSAPPADTLDGTAILKAMEAQHSILVERAQGIYSFSHLTFQEYLTARYLAENQGRGVTHTLIRDHLTDRRWREVFLLTASLLDDGADFIKTLQNAVAGLVTKAPTLLHMLTWAQVRRQATWGRVEPRQATQLAYVFLSIFLARSRLLVLAIESDRGRALERNIALDQTLAFALALALALAPELALSFENEVAQEREIANVFARSRSFSLVLTRASDRDFSRSLTYELSLALVQVLSHARDSAIAISTATAMSVGVDYGLYYAWRSAALFAAAGPERANKEWHAMKQELSSLLQEVVILAGEAGLTDLAQQLVIQPIPVPRVQEWQPYADWLLALLRDERDLAQEWDFSDQEINQLNDYFYANALLVQCLKVAAVTDRQAVLNGLLLPPAQQESEA